MHLSLLIFVPNTAFTLSPLLLQKEQPFHASPNSQLISRNPPAHLHSLGQEDPQCTVYRTLSLASFPPLSILLLDLAAFPRASRMHAPINRTSRGAVRTARGPRDGINSSAFDCAARFPPQPPAVVDARARSWTRD